MSGSASNDHHLTQGNAGYSNPHPAPASNEYERMHCTTSRKRTTPATETKKSRLSRSIDIYYEEHDSDDKDDNEDGIDEMSQAMWNPHSTLCMIMMRILKDQFMEETIV